MASTRQRGNRFTGLYRDPQGKQRSAGTYDTADEALARARVAELDANPPAAVEALPGARRGKITVAGYAPGWLENCRLEETSREAYRTMLKHLTRGLGSVCVADLDDERCGKFFRKLEAGKLSTGTVCLIRTVLLGMCKSAVKAGLLDAVPEIKIAPVRNKEMMIATRAQAAAIGRAVPAHLSLLVETLFATGMRYGEAAGIGPEHVELHDTHAVIKVGRRVIAEVRNAPAVKTYGKTSNSVRDIVIPLDLGKRLLANAANGYVFRAQRGGYLRRTHFRKYWVAACASAGVPGLRVHDARHSHASWLANDPRVPLAAVRDRLGHGNIAITSRYVHSTTPPETILAALAVGGVNELEPASPVSVAMMLAAELREVADLIESCPELMNEPDPYDAALRYLMSRDELLGE